MTISKNEGIEKEGNGKDKQYQKNGDKWKYQKTEKNRVLNIHSICNCSDHLFSVSYGYILSFMFDLTFPGYFRKLWRISDLISIYYLSVKNWPCNLWIEIFDKLRIYCWVWPNFCWGNFGKLLVTFLAKIRTTVL